jgi:DNA-directed RNA polymerase subunit L
MEKRRYEQLKVKVLKKEANELKIEIEGAGHGLCNLLQKKLLEDEKVDLAGYDIPHPLASSPVIYVRMKGAAKPEDALIRAAEKAREANAAFSKELKTALKA